MPHPVLGTFNSPAALLRLAGHVLIEQHDEWGGGNRRYFSANYIKLRFTEPETWPSPN
jgi:putative transposase